MATRHFLFLIAIGVALLLGLAMNFVQASSGLMKAHNGGVRDGAKVTVQYQITLRDNPTITYSATEQFIQGQHIIPLAIEQQMVGMQSGETKMFPLSAEEGFGPYDETKTQTILTANLPLDARAGDIVDDDAGRTAKIVSIFPETTVLDLNHPLAGHPLLVMLQIVRIEIPGDTDTNTETKNGDHPDLIMVDPGTDLVYRGRDLQRLST
jgi:FKBP-type peptidyl-prolyl cis-trans isomerase 2